MGYPSYELQTEKVSAPLITDSDETLQYAKHPVSQNAMPTTVQKRIKYDIRISVRNPSCHEAFSSVSSSMR